MKNDSMNIVIIGLSLSSSWGNGHATTYRSLVKGLHQEGHQVDFLERDVSWYANNRDLTSSPHCNLHFYKSTDKLKQEHRERIIQADVVVVGSYLKHGVDIGNWVTDTAPGVTAFYDIDTPVTLDKLSREDYEYIHPELIPKFDLYLSFSGGEILEKLEQQYGAQAAKPFYCSVDPDLYYPESHTNRWQIGYLGTYSDDRQPTLDELLIQTAKKRSEDSFVVAGPQYPSSIDWPENVKRIEHLPPAEHREFYNQQGFTLNVTRAAMIQAGFSPSVRLFEAAACATPIISDFWQGLDTLFEPGREILIARTTQDVLQHLKEYSEQERKKMGERAREKVLNEHSSRERAKQLIDYVQELKKVAV